MTGLPVAVHDNAIRRQDSHTDSGSKSLLAVLSATLSLLYWPEYVPFTISGFQPSIPQFSLKFAQNIQAQMSCNVDRRQAATCQFLAEVTIRWHTANVRIRTSLEKNRDDFKVLAFDGKMEKCPAAVIDIRDSPC